MRRAAGLLALALMGCTPAEQQVAKTEGVAVVKELVQCIITNAAKPGATASSVALTCGIEAAAGTYQLINDEIQASKMPKASAP